MERKTVVFQTRGRFAAYSAAIVAAGLAIGLVFGIFITVFAMRMMKNVKEQAEEKAVEEASGEDYDITKCVILGKYSGREISLVATEEDIELEIDNLLEENTTYEKIKSGTAKDGDLVYASFEGSVKGKVADTTCGSDYILIGSGEWLQGFEAAVIGMKPGETKKFSVDVPKGFYGDDTVDGQTVTFRLKLKYICGDAIVPEYNDEFVQAVTQYETVEEYNVYLKRRIERENEDEKEEFVWTEVLDESEVTEYPDSLMEAARTEVLNGYYDMADLYGVSHDEIFQSFGCEDEQDFKDTQLEDLAQDTVKELLVAQAIAFKEGIEYTEEDYEKLVKDEYENYSDMYDSQEAFEKANRNYLERTIITEAVKEWIGTKTTFKK